MMLTKNYCAPFGEIILSACNGLVTGLHFVGGVTAPTLCKLPRQEIGKNSSAHIDDGENHAVLEQLTKELDAYFAGDLQNFTTPIHLEGTAFRKTVWQALCTIPYGETISYKELAIRIGNPAAIRAVGGANHHNPISILVPCHRVIGANGKLVGYGGGMHVKEFLLRHEGDNM